mgnify:CR=1 FL=1
MYGFYEKTKEGDNMQLRLETKQLNYSIDGFDILKGISINVEDKKMVGIIGPNGSGKTTLLKHIYRALPSEYKKVFIDGRDIENYTHKQSARKLTVVRQENSSDFDFTVEKMVLLGRAPYRRSFESYTKEDMQFADDALNAIGMEAYRYRSFNTLSGGEKQRVLIARSLAQQADIFVLDEPTNHLDVHYQWSIMALIRRLNTTVLGVYHNLNLAAQFCDELYVLCSGHVVASGTPKEVLTPKLMAEVFGVEADIMQLKNGRLQLVINEAMTAQ